jgi:uncharacterized protein YegP (UPF0339 family)
MYKDSVGEWRWRMKAANGRIIANGGEGYKRFGDMDKTLASLWPMRDHFTVVKGA